MVSNNTLPCMQKQRALERRTDMRRLAMPLLSTDPSGEPAQCLALLNELEKRARHATGKVFGRDKGCLENVTVIKLV